MDKAETKILSNKQGNKIPTRLDVWRANFILFLPIIILYVAMWFYGHSKHYEQYHDKYWVPGYRAYQHGDYKTALYDFRQYEKPNPYNPYLHEIIAETLQKQGDLKGARRVHGGD